MKSPRLILANQVPVKFDAAAIKAIADEAKIPATANLQNFGDAVRDAATRYIEAAKKPQIGAVRKEIEGLYRQASKAEKGDAKAVNETARRLVILSPTARQFLNQRVKRGLPLPTPSDLSNNRCEDAISQLLRLLCWGGVTVQGRAREDGKRSRPKFKPLLWAPAPRRGRPSNEAEREFVMWLSIAYLEATDRSPPRTVNSRAKGPFCRMVESCLKRVGAGHVDVVEAINAAGSLREPSKNHVALSCAAARELMKNGIPSTRLNQLRWECVDWQKRTLSLTVSSKPIFLKKNSFEALRALDAVRNPEGRSGWILSDIPKI